MCGSQPGDRDHRSWPSIGVDQEPGSMGGSMESGPEGAGLALGRTGNLGSREPPGAVGASPVQVPV